MGIAATLFLNMATLRQMNERLQNFDTKKVLMDVFMESNALVIEKNLDQLQEGKDSKGSLLKQYASQEYAEYKNQLNPKAGMGNPDLKLTGSFWQGFKLTQDGDTEYSIKSEDSKAGKLEEKYGKDIYGMAEDKKGEFVKQTYRPALRKRIKELLKL